MARADSLRTRAGQIFCACDIDGLPLDLDAMPKDASLLRMATAFGLTVLSLSLGTVCFATRKRSTRNATKRFAIALSRTALRVRAREFPRFILDGYVWPQIRFCVRCESWSCRRHSGRMGVIHPSISGIHDRRLWLGMAQGFGLFYRHAAAMSGGAGGLVFGAGVVGALIAPFIISLLASLFGPFASAATLAASGLVSPAMLGIAVTLPSRRIEIETVERDVKRPSWILFLGATEIAALAWLGMTGIMAHAPLAMAGCGMSMSMSAVAMAGAFVSHVLAGLCDRAIGCEAWRIPDKP